MSVCGYLVKVCTHAREASQSVAIFTFIYIPHPSMPPLPKEGEELQIHNKESNNRLICISLKQSSAGTRLRFAGRVPDYHSAATTMRVTLHRHLGVTSSSRGGEIYRRRLHRLPFPRRKSSCAC